MDPQLIEQIKQSLPAALAAIFSAQAGHQDGANKHEFPKARMDSMRKAARTRITRKHYDSLTDATKAILECLGSSYRMDAGESVFFARQLEYMRPGLFEVLYPDLIAKKIIPVNNGVDPGAEQYTYRAYDRTGKAIVIKNYSEQAPRVDVKGIESVTQIRGLADSYGYNLQELRAAMFAQLPLDVRKAMAARDVMERLIDDIGFYGDTASGLTGLANLANAGTYTVPVVAGSALWRSKSADQIAADMHGICNYVVKNSLGIEQPDTLALPLAAFTIVATKRMGDGSNQTVLDYFLKTSPYCKKVVPSYKLDAANHSLWSNSSTQGRMIAYRQDPMKLELVIPQEFEQLPPDKVGFEYVTVCHARCAGVVGYYPASIAYGDGITDGSD